MMEASAASVGITLTEKVSKKLEALLANANGKRRKFLLAPSDVMQAVLDAMASPHGIGVRHGGGDLMQKTSLCLAVQLKKDPTKVVVGIGTCWDRPTPGRIWKNVSPWQQDHAKNVDKAAAWAKEKNKTDRVTIEVDAKPTAKSKVTAKAKATDGAKLLASILANPADNDARLVYADWLSQNGDPRGELITVQCAIAAKGRNTALEKREKELLKRHKATWTKSARQVAIDCDLTRGFVSRIKAKAITFANNGAAVFESDPIETLRLDDPTSSGLRLLAKAKHLGKLRELEILPWYSISRTQDVNALRELLLSEHLGKVRELRLHISPTSGVDVSNVWSDVSLPGLEILDVQRVPSRVLESLAEAKLPRLREIATSLPKGDRDAIARAFKKATFR